MNDILAYLAKKSLVTLCQWNAIYVDVIDFQLYIGYGMYFLYDNIILSYST